MARRLFRKKRPQQSRFLAVFLIAVLCLGAGYALWFTDSTPQRETAQINAPVATDAGQPIKLPSGFGAAFIDRPSMRLGSLVENDRRSEDSAAAPPATEPGAVDLPVPRAEPTAGTVRPTSPMAEPPRPTSPMAETPRPTSAPAASQAVASGNGTSGQSGEQPRAAAQNTPPAAPESPSSGLATEPAAGPVAPPSPAQPVESVTVAALTPAPAATPPSEPEVAPETTEWVPRPVPRARQAEVPPANVPDVNDEESIDVGRPAPTTAPAPAPAPSSRDDTFAIVAAPLRPVVVPPSLDDEPLLTERESPTRTLDDDDFDLPPATSRNVARSLVTTAVRDREPVRTLGDTVSLREIDRGQLYYFTELTGLMGRKVEHRWIYRGRVEGTMRFQVGSNRWRASSRKTVLPDQKGEWRVIVVDEAGRTLGGTRLVVE